MTAIDHSEQIANHQGTWVRAEKVQALQAKVDELTAEVADLREKLAAAESPEK